MNFSATCISLVLLHPTLPNTTVAHIGCRNLIVVAAAETRSVQPEAYSKAIAPILPTRHTIHLPVQKPRPKKARVRNTSRFGVTSKCGKQVAFWYRRDGHWYYKCL